MAIFPVPGAVRIRLVDSSKYYGLPAPDAADTADCFDRVILLFYGVFLLIIIIVECMKKVIGARWECECDLNA